MLSVLLVLGVAGQALAQSFDARSGRFPDVDRMESSLIKGVSTKADVAALLGKPNGRGGALSNLEPQRPREIWLYEELGASLIGMERGVARIHVDQQFLMIYFVDGIFDGFWWHDNAAPVTAALGIGAGAAASPTASPTLAEAISTPEDFANRVVGRPLATRDGAVRLIVDADGTIKGTRNDGGSVSGTWYFKDGFFCRTSRSGTKKLPWDCLIVTIEGNEVTVHRDRGSGERVTYKFL